MDVLGVVHRKWGNREGTLAETKVVLQSHALVCFPPFFYVFSSMCASSITPPCLHWILYNRAHGTRLCES